MCKVEVHILTWNDEEILPWTLKHYATFASSITIHDDYSIDQTRNIARRFGAKIVDSGGAGQFSDSRNSRIKSTCWPGSKADWIICVDSDELIYFPREMRITLARCLEAGTAVIKPRGFEMWSDRWPTTLGQIYEEIKMGAPDDKWYGKPCLFTPHLVDQMLFSPGAHEAQIGLKGDPYLHAAPQQPNTVDPVYLLHYHQIGPMERIARRYDEVQKRFCTENKMKGWSNYGDGFTHATDKRTSILSRLIRVVE